MTEGGFLMNAIVAVGRNWGIGAGGKLLFRIPEDMRRFRKMTEGKTVAMGRKTLESLPGGKPLPNRRNVILSSSMKSSEGIEVCRGKEELLEKLKGIPEEDVFVIGGGEVYRLLLPLCRKAYVTKIDAERPSDVFFPNLDEEEGWEMTDEGIRIPETDETPAYSFAVYENARLRPAK